MKYAVNPCYLVCSAHLDQAVKERKGQKLYLSVCAFRPSGPLLVAEKIIKAF